jgi:acetylornithine deacetylase/succinyl-diaminopimelate desuccinylase-like protein
LPKYFPGATDARYLRNANYTALGFSPLPKTEPLQHQDNEFMNENTFLKGILVYEKLLPRLTSVDPQFDTTN